MSDIIFVGSLIAFPHSVGAPARVGLPCTCHSRLDFRKGLPRPLWPDRRSQMSSFGSAPNTYLRDCFVLPLFSVPLAPGVVLLFSAEAT